MRRFFLSESEKGKIIKIKPQTVIVEVEASAYEKEMEQIMLLSHANNTDWVEELKAYIEKDNLPFSLYSDA